MPHFFFNGGNAPAGLNPRCRRRLDQSRNDDNGHVQRRRHRDLPRTQPSVRKARCARRERVEMKHDQGSRKGSATGNAV